MSGGKLIMGLALIIATTLWFAREPIAMLYAEDPNVRAYAQVLIAWVAIYHVLDAGQCLLYFSLRAWRITLSPMLVYGVGMWGVGVGGGWILSRHVFAPTAEAAQGFWIAAIAGLSLTCLGLAYLLRRRFLNPVVPVVT
jgi:multidrug resistance protein, MATE family